MEQRRPNGEEGALPQLENVEEVGSRKAADGDDSEYSPSELRFSLDRFQSDKID